MAEAAPPITRQVTKEARGASGGPPADIRLEDVEDCPLWDRHGASAPLKDLYRDSKCVIIFVRVGEDRVWFGSMCQNPEDDGQELSKVGLKMCKAKVWDR